jgi:endonuclease/exonuclease/phosphatase family metal-dependent hydrolase
MPVSRMLLFSHSAPRLAGAVLFVAITLAAGCREKRPTPSWSQSASGVPPITQPANPSDATKTSKHGKKHPLPDSAPQGDTPSSDQLRFVAFNTENYLTMDRFINGQQQPSRPKPESEKNALASIIAAQHPDIVGVCEIGSKDDLADLQKRLKDTGCDLPVTHYTGGVDETRHLAILSRFPIIATADPSHLTYKLGGSTFGMQRGILDISISAREKIWHFVGVHLKSKRQVADGDEATMRHNEARLLREHLDAILSAHPSERLVVYGDFNDTRDSPVIHMIEGPFNAPASLIPLALKDTHGETWTQYWGLEDIYSRIDWIMVSRPLKPDVDSHACRVLDPANWRDASDHRGLLAVFHN